MRNIKRNKRVYFWNFIIISMGIFLCCVHIKSIESLHLLSLTWPLSVKIFIISNTAEAHTYKTKVHTNIFHLYKLDLYFCIYRKNIM